MGDPQDYPGDLRALVGSFGPALRQFALGQDDRPLELGDEIKSVSGEETFLKDTDNRKVLRACLRERPQTSPPGSSTAGWERISPPATRPVSAPVGPEGRKPLEIQVASDASTKLVILYPWYSIQPNTLINGSAYFSDPQWTNYLATSTVTVVRPVQQLFTRTASCKAAHRRSGCLRRPPGQAHRIDSLRGKQQPCDLRANDPTPPGCRSSLLE